MLTVPTEGDNDHITPVFVPPFTVAVNCFDCAEVSDAEAGDRAIHIRDGCSKTVAAALLVESAVLVAVIVIVWLLVMVDGAV